MARAERQPLRRAHIRRLSPRRWARRHAQSLARAAAGLLREPQRARTAGSVRPRTRLRCAGSAPADRARTRPPLSRRRRPRSTHHLPSTLPLPIAAARVFPNLDGIRFLTHEGGCGGTRQDTRALCGLLAGYLVHPNVAGATVLSLGCQHAQVDILREEIAARDAGVRQAAARLRAAADGHRRGAA